MTESLAAGQQITVPPAGRYRIDPERSTVTFTTRHLFGLAAVRGTLALREGSVTVAGPVTGSAVRAQVAASTFQSRNPARDVSVLSRRLLDAETYPVLTFTSTALVREEGQWLLRGELEVRGVTRLAEARITAVSPDADGAAFRASASVTADRCDFGITAYRGLAARRLTVDLDIPAEREERP
ncbi:MAG TPA: YceI family protein [Trebonia sp.]|nr:YceI family protein [Trebonia sp.]